MVSHEITIGTLQQDARKATLMVTGIVRSGPSAPSPPPFVGENYFCESGTTVPERFQWFLDDPLWDAQGCVSGSSCCDRGQWFIRTLSQEMTDNIEVSWCSRESAENEDIGVEQLEILIH